MVDYYKNTGSSGQMRIRDTGSVVEFWINSGNSSTYHSALPWGYTVNGVTNNTRTFNYGAGDGWQKLGSWTVTTDQTVYFRIRDTGTSGFGGPTSFGLTIDRAAPPNAPAIQSITSVTHNSAHIVIAYGFTNGAAIDATQIASNKLNQITGAAIVSSDGSTTVTGLSPGTLYYFFARAHNAKGWGAWSPYKTATTLRVPDASDIPILSDPTQTSFVASFTDNGNGGATILERQLTYNTTNTVTGGTSVNYTGVTTITGLQPATTYYVWSRVRNSAGWSSYSSPAVIRTIAGAYVLVGPTTWKEAVPYVKVAGVWKLARPWSRTAGVWKETT